MASAVSFTFFLVFRLILASFFRALDTVECDIPSCFAISRIVTANREFLSCVLQDAGRTYYVEKLVPSFEKETGIEVDLMLMSWEGFIEQFLLLHAAGQAPDVAQLGGMDLGTFVVNGLVRPLDDWTKDWDEINDFASSAIVDGIVNGKLYSIPYRLDQRTLLYRKDFFEEAGLDSSRPPEDWQSLLETAQKLVRYNEDSTIRRAGFNTGPAGDLTSIFIYQNGGRLVSTDGREIMFHTPEAEEGIQFLVDMVVEHQVGLPTGSPWEGSDPIVTGLTSMEYAGDWNLGLMDQWLPGHSDNLGVALPAGNVNRSGFLYVNKWVISSTTNNPDGAWRWIEYVSRPEIMHELSRVNSFFPARRGALSGPPFSEDDRWHIFFAAAEETVPLPSNVYNLPKVSEHLSKAMEKVLSEGQSLSPTLAEAARLALQEILEH